MSRPKKENTEYRKFRYDRINDIEQDEKEIKDDSKNFISLFYPIIRDKKLSYLEKIIYSYILGFCKHGKHEEKTFHYCEASNKYIAHILGLKESTISSKISDLRRKGYVAIILKRTNNEKGVISTKRMMRVIELNDARIRAAEAFEKKLKQEKDDYKIAIVLGANKEGDVTNVVKFKKHA